MAIRDIVKDSDPLLRKSSRAVVEYNDKLHKLLDDMYVTMLDADGVGLAAPQVGILRRLFVIDNGEIFIEAVNPRICAVAGSQISQEGCLSVIDRNCDVLRPMRVMVEYFDRDGIIVHKELDGANARVFCHELDHLDGKLFYDREHIYDGDKA